jgi:hypothetical protein
MSPTLIANYQFHLPDKGRMKNKLCQMKELFEREEDGEDNEKLYRSFTTQQIHCLIRRYLVFIIPTVFCGTASNCPVAEVSCTGFVYSSLNEHLLHLSVCRRKDKLQGAGRLSRKALISAKN